MIMMVMIKISEDDDHIDNGDDNNYYNTSLPWYLPELNDLHWLDILNFEVNLV